MMKWLQLVKLVILKPLLAQNFLFKVKELILKKIVWLPYFTYAEDSGLLVNTT